MAPTKEDYVRRAEIELSGDHHTLRASAVYEVPPEKVTHYQRHAMKEVGFGEIYGTTVDTLRKRLKVSRETVIRMQEVMHADIPALRRLQEERKSTRQTTARHSTKRIVPDTTDDDGHQA